MVHPNKFHPGYLELWQSEELAGNFAQLLCCAQDRGAAF